MAKEYGVSRDDDVHKMGEHGTHQHPPYMAIFYILLALTVLEVGSTGVVNKYIGVPEEFAIPHPWVVPWLLILSAIKAVLVAMYYMHLKFDKRVYSLIIGGPLLFAAIFVALTIRWG